LFVSSLVDDKEHDFRATVAPWRPVFYPEPVLWLRLSTIALADRSRAEGGRDRRPRDARRLLERFEIYREIVREGCR